MDTTETIKFTVIGAVDVGKCWEVGTPIRMYDGSIKPVEEICVGDSVMGVDGRPKGIIETHVGEGKLYEVSQHTGDSYVVSEHHVLVLGSLSNRPPATPVLVQVEMSVMEYLSLSDQVRRDLRGLRLDGEGRVTTTRITVSERPMGRYAGFQIEGDGTFLAPDSTIWHNSTICGQILAKSNWIDDRSLQKIFETADRDNMTRSKWARVLDIFEDEMLRGKTHEYVNIPFSYGGRNYELVDTPGHLIFIREMITGISGVKIGCLVLSMINNEFEASFERGTIKEHLMIAKASGVEKMVILANKMDAVSWDREVFLEKCKRVTAFLKRLGFHDGDVTAIPVSGWLGIGLCDNTDMPEWHLKGSSKCLLEELASIHSSLVRSGPTSTGGATEGALRGERFVLDMRIINYPSIITIGFTAIFHIGGEEHEVTLVGLNKQKFIKNGDKCYAMWKFPEEVQLHTNAVIIRKDTQTIGFGKVIKAL